MFHPCAAQAAQGFFFGALQSFARRSRCHRRLRPGDPPAARRVDPGPQMAGTGQAAWPPARSGHFCPSRACVFSATAHIQTVSRASPAGFRGRVPLGWARLLEYH